jgi:YegS/Rv2252/BmrU family lipid kinase
MKVNPDRRQPWVAIVNPAAGRAHENHWRAIERALRAARIEFDAIRTEGPRHAQELARTELQRGRRRILAVGGDGSVNEIVHGIMSAGLADARDVTLAVAPLGTGNDWARSLGIDRDPTTIARTITADRGMLHDVGAIDFPAASAERRWFINVAGAGYDAYVTERVPRPVPSALTYLRIVLTGLLTYRSPQFVITAGTERIEGKLLLAFVANGRYCGNRMLVAPVASMDDGLFDVVWIRDLSPGQALVRLPILYDGRILGDPAVSHLRTAQVRIDTDPAVAVQADGEILGRTPAEFSIRREALRVIVR